MMKSREKKKKIDKLILKWDSKALPLSSIRKNVPPDYDKQRPLDEYLDFLDEIRPHIQELRRLKVFDKPFKI